MKRFALLKIVGAAALALAYCNGQSQTPQTTVSERQTAIALEQQGDDNGAEAAWRAVLTANPANAEAYAHLGLLEARQQHYSKAVSLYRRALALNPEMLGLRLNLGLSLFKSGDMKGAIQAFEPLLKSAPPSSPDAQRLNTLIGMAYYGLGAYAAAVPYLKKVTANDPQELHYRLILAQSCLNARQYQCVLDVYHQILTLNAESAEADMLAGEALDAMRDHGGAIEQFRAAVKADPSQPNAHFGLGYLLWTQNQFDQAAPEFKAELTMAPDNAEAMVFLADCDIRTGRKQDALPLIEKALQLDPRMERAHLDLGILDADAGKREDAVREFRIAVRLSPGDADVHWRLARLYQAMGMKDEAKIEFDKTSSLHKAENDTVFSRLKAAQQRGKPADGAASSLGNP
jgi:tetratricopeptide (TPR) repeat protein